MWLPEVDSPTKPKLKVSFSGGRTSAYMAKRIKDEWAQDYDIVFIFANTGREREETLEFVHKCDQAWGLGVVWVEAEVYHGEERSSGHRVVTFETASRNGEPFEEVIKKYGISNFDFEPCNRELKLNAMNSYMRSIGWLDYYTAIGIRADENRRVNTRALPLKLLYPLVATWPTDKQDIGDFWEDQPFKLNLEEHHGNCKTCFKKSDRKLFKVYSETPEAFEWNQRMEEQYGWHGAPFYGEPTPEGKPRVWFRGTRSTEQLLAEARLVGVQPYVPIRDMRSMAARQFSMDFESGGCTESCEAYPMEMVA
jgi:hypothetical protein